MSSRVVGVVKVPVIDLAATGRNIKNLRVSAGISVRDLQNILGFTNPQAIYKWQNGDSLPSIDNLVILAAVLGVTVDEILVVDGDDSGDGEVTLESPVIYRRYNRHKCTVVTIAAHKCIRLRDEPE